MHAYNKMLLPPKAAEPPVTDTTKTLANIIVHNYCSLQRFFSVSIVAVKELTHFKTCLSCKAKITITDEADLVTCHKCSTTQKSNKSPTKIIAKLLIEGPNVNIITLVGYEDILNQVTMDKQLSAQTLLEASPFDVTYKDFHVITSVCRHS